MYKLPSFQLKKMVAEKRGWNLEKSKNFAQLREDYLLKSKKFAIFAVADGVTLVIKPGKPYPVPSGAGEVAKYFAEVLSNKLKKSSVTLKRRISVIFFQSQRGS